MTKRQTRTFFFVATVFFAAIFVAMTVDTHFEAVKLTHADELTPAVHAGKQVWHDKDCTNCHTLLGEGAYYAPDLTKIAQQRGAAYLHAFLKDPSKFYSESKDRRLMPNLKLSDEQADDLVAFLTWIARIDTQGWPPRPIVVPGGAVPAAFEAERPQAASGDPVALGEALFRSSPPACFACHSATVGVTLVGPSLGDVGARAEATVKSPDYRGAAKDAAGCPSCPRPALSVHPALLARSSRATGPCRARASAARRRVSHRHRLPRVGFRSW